MKKQLAWGMAAGGLLLILSGCSSVYQEDSQQELAQKYYSGDLDGAAEFALTASDDLAETDNEDALLWHLEAGSTNLDAGRYEEALTALNRAEKLIYQLDGGQQWCYHRQGDFRYRGTRSDRLVLHLLKGFYYLASGSLEDFQVEIRRMRQDQFRYVFSEADPEIRTYEAQNAGKSGVDTLAMQRILQKPYMKQIFASADLADAYKEYSERRRPELPLLFNPLPFYLSCIGYCFDREYQEAVIDLRYLLLLEPQNQLYRQDFTVLSRALGDPLPKSFAAPEPLMPLHDDQVVCIILGYGQPIGWSRHDNDYQLPGMVPTSWQLSVPDFTPLVPSRFTAGWQEGTLHASTPLVDLGEVIREEFFQREFPQLARSAYDATLAMTVAHRSAEAALIAAQAAGDNGQIAAAVAAATVVATSRAYVNQSEWRRWITMPRGYAFLHLPLPADPQQRHLAITVSRPEGGTDQKIELDFTPDTNRAVVYIRQLPNGNCHTSKWESSE